MQGRWAEGSSRPWPDVGVRRSARVHRPAKRPFAPSGWTRDYNVQMVQNFERRERGATERTITAKIVVTCKVTIYGFGTHTGSARSGRTTTTPARQRKPRRSSGHVRVSGLAAICTIWKDSGWISTRRNAHWRRRNCPIGHAQSGKRTAARSGAERSHHANGQHKQGQRRGDNGKGGLYRNELLGQVKVLCGRSASVSRKACFRLSRRSTIQTRSATWQR